MHHRFVLGLRDRKLKERLQLTHDLTLTRALEIAKQDERIEQQMKAAGIIREVKEPTVHSLLFWCAPMVPVVKHNGSIRICVGLKRLNMAVKRPQCVLPSLDGIAPRMAGATVFSTLNASSGFFQVPINRKSMPLTTFITSFRLVAIASKECLRESP